MDEIKEQYPKQKEKYLLQSRNGWKLTITLSCLFPVSKRTWVKCLYCEFILVGVHYKSFKNLGQQKLSQVTAADLYSPHHLIR